MTESLDVEQTSVGCETDGSQLVQVFKAPSDLELARIVDGRLGAKRLTFLVVLLDPAPLVIDMQRGGYAVGDDPRAEATRGVAHDPAVEHQADLAGAADIEVLADNL